MTTARTRHRSADPFGNARGHDYIRLRGLSPLFATHPALRVAEDCACQACIQARQLPGVLQLLERWTQPAMPKRGARVVPLRGKK